MISTYWKPLEHLVTNLLGIKVVGGPKHMLCQAEYSHMFCDGSLNHFLEPVPRMSAELARVAVMREGHLCQFPLQVSNNGL